MSRAKPLVATNGYVTIFKPNHHLSMANGYVYVHRLVMEEKLGRSLEPGEEPHHIDENKTNNHPDNLELKTKAQHTSDHHKKRADLRPIGGDNPEITCKCGCGQTFPQYDTTGRPRKFITGHNRNAANSPGKVAPSH